MRHFKFERNLILATSAVMISIDKRGGRCKEVIQTMRSVTDSRIAKILMPNTVHELQSPL